MPTPTFTPGDNKQDERLNPGQQDYDRRFSDQVNGSAYPDVEKGLRDLEDFKNNQDKSAANDTSSLTARERDNGSTFKNNYTGSSAGPSQGKGGVRKLLGKVRVGKKSGIAGVIVFVLGILGIGGTLFTPGLGIIQMKEMLTTNLNDQLSAMDIRSQSVFRAKLSNMSRGVCTGVQIKCKFASMNDRQIERFKKAGFTITEDSTKSTLFGRKVITTMTAPNGATINNPNDLMREWRSSSDVRGAMKRVYNPLYYSLSDKVANTFLANNKTSKQKKVTGSTDEERRAALKESTSGERTGSGGILRDSVKGEYIFNETGEKVFSSENPDDFNRLKQASNDKLGPLNTLAEGGKATGKVIGGTLKGVGILGVADNACSVYNAARAVAAAAKVARAMQLIQFAMVINSTADSIMAGDATPEEVEFVGSMLSDTDTRQKVTDPSSGIEAQIDNPNYGKSAYDSAGYKVAAYNEAPTLNAQSVQYMIGGGLSGSLSSTLSDVEKVIGGGSPANIRNTCGAVQNFWVRGAGLVAGIIVGIGSFGVATLVSVAGSAAISFALPFLEAMLADVVAGNVIAPDISATDAGDAAFAGNAALLGGVAQNRGMTPQSAEGMQSYLAATSQSRSEAIADEKELAQKTPFDINNQYSFIGSFARSLYPTAVSAKAGLNGALLSVGSIVTKGFGSLTKPASAAQAFNPERFNKCNDPGYAELGIDADVFCNVRYGLTQQELGMDTEAVVDFMIERGYVSETGKPQNGYDEFMKNCANRTDGWGDTSEENGSIGSECMNADKWPDISYFRVFTMDNSINDGMDGDVDPSANDGVAEAIESGGSTVLPVEPGYAPFSDQADWGPRTVGTSFHRGIDFGDYPGGATGKPVKAIADGEVVSFYNGNPTCSFGGTSYGRNNVLRIRHADGTVSGYWHMPLSSVTVKVGDKVTAGQQIGSIGKCGLAYGPHLHFTMEPFTSNDPAVQAIERNREFMNPQEYLRIRGVNT